MWIENDGVYGTIDILPTPQGQIINSLIDYGSEIGISSRGSGSVSGNEVDPDDYTFVTFDIVMRPSVEAARLDLRMVESENINVDEVKSILNEYQEVNKSKSSISNTAKQSMLDSTVSSLLESLK